MIKKNKVIGIILARSGSKGLKNKNSRPLLGKPLLTYSIEAGKKSKYIDHLILSSDCDICIEIAKNYKVDVPFKRPKKLSGDTVPSADVIEHAITFLKKQDLEFDIIVLIEPTSPLRTSEDIDNALEKMMKTNSTSIVSVSKVEDQHPDFCFLLKNEKLKNYAKRNFKVKRRQDIEDIFFLEGSVYASFIDSFLKEKSFCQSDTAAYIVPKWKSFEIDDIWDFINIEAIMKFNKKSKNAKKK